MIDVIATIAFLFIGNWFYQQHEHVKFDYKDSFWNKMDDKLSKPWFKNNARPENKKAFPWLPPVWDGYHFFSWIMKVCYFITAAIPSSYYLPERWMIIPAGLGIGIISFTIDQVTYSWTFK